MKANTPKSKPTQDAKLSPRWKIRVTEAPRSAFKLLTALKFQPNQYGEWIRPIWTERQGAFLIDTVKAAGCHGQVLSFAKQAERDKAAVDRIEKAKRERNAARAAKRRRELEHQAETLAQRDAYRRAEAVARIGLHIAGQ